MIIIIILISSPPHHHHYDNAITITGEAPLSANPPEVWLDLSDLLQEQNQLTTLTSTYLKQVEENITTTNLPSNENNNNNKHDVLYANSYFNEVGILCNRALTNILVKHHDYFYYNVD